MLLALCGFFLFVSLFVGKTTKKDGWMDELGRIIRKCQNG